MKILKYITTIIILGAVLFLAAKTTSADNTSYIYGGVSQAGGIVLQKQVRLPDQNTFVDNLGPSDSKFLPLGAVTFKLTIQNTSNQNFSMVNISDTLPAFLTFVSGPGVISYNPQTNQLSFSTNDLKSGQSKEFLVNAKVVSQDKLPKDKSLVCVTNSASAQADSFSDNDTASLCIANISGLPPTGINPTILGGIIGLGLSGIFLIKKAKLG